MYVQLLPDKLVFFCELTESSKMSYNASLKLQMLPLNLKQ